MESTENNQTNNTDLFNKHAYGCILGAFIGDATGTYNEFGKEELDD